MKPFLYIRKVLLPLVLLTAAGPSIFTAVAQPDRRTILVLHSYHKADWTDNLNKGIDSVLGNLADLNLIVEYMDTKRLKTKAYYHALDAIYRQKYGRMRFDVILTSDDNAYRFALARQTGLFNRAPIVFCGVNRFDPLEIENNPLVTGVVERGDFQDTLGFARRIHTKAGAVHVILDHTPTAQINMEGFLGVMKQHHPELAVRYLIDLSLHDLATHLAALPREDFAFFISFWKDTQGQPVSPEQLSPVFFQSAVPIYGRSEWMLDKGLTGGKCVSGFHQGEAAAQLAQRILNGEDVSAMPLILDSPNRFMFDHHLLTRFDIHPALLPIGSIIFNQPAPTFYEKHYFIIWSAVVVFSLLTALVLYLAFNVVSRHRTESALRSSETRFRTLVENAADAIFLSDTSGRLVDVNRRACEGLGYTREELLACHLADIDANLESKEALERLWAGLRPGRPVSIESCHRRKDGSVFPVQLRIAMLQIGEKHFTLSLAQDITKRKEIEAELRESEARYRQLVQYAPAGIYEFDMQQLRFLNVNDVMCEYTGYTEEEFLKLDLSALLTNDSVPTLTHLLETLSPDNPTPPPVEYCIQGKSGEIFWVLVNSRFKFEDGVPIRATAVVHNLTALREAEAEKKRLEEKLVEIQKFESLGNLAGGIAHDFNNLLMGIQGNASLMEWDEDRKQDDLELLHNIESYVQRGVELTRQLMGMARGGKYEVKPTDLNILVKESAAIFSRTKKEIRIDHDQQKEIWTVACDRGQIDQILLNIFVNAWQAMPTGGQIFIKTQNTHLDSAMVDPHGIPAGRYVKVSIRDTGIGMDPATMAKIFDPFFTTKARESGTGLGLASAYGIVKNHDGIIDVSSRPGEGSTFHIYLPAVEAEASDDEVAAETRLLHGSEKVLLVDDEVMVLDVGQKILEKLGYRVTPAASGSEALNIFRRDGAAIDLVVLDMIMPDMSGADTFTQLKAIDPNICVLLSSGYSVDGQATEILDQGCRGFIQKPFNVRALSHKVREVLDQT